MSSLFLLLAIFVAVPSLAGPSQSSHCKEGHSDASESPGPSKSERAVQELHESYSDFLALTREQLISDIEFISKQFTLITTRVLFRYPEHLRISKTKFKVEKTRAYQVLFGSVIYIVNPNDEEILGYLVRDAHLTQEELTQMDLIRNSYIYEELRMFAVTEHLDTFDLSYSYHKVQEAWRSIARRLMQDLEEDQVYLF